MDDTITPCILVVDDDELLRSVIIDLLEMSGYRVAAAASASAGIDFCRLTPPNLVLLDALMPDMDGFECCRILRTEPSTQNIPILMMTALSEGDTAEQIIAAGATDYVVKPFKPQHLLRLIATLIASSAQTPY
ncbi:MAG: response regulator [Cyanobacteria bacterium J06642_2]